jgi:hypothetical protein
VGRLLLVAIPLVILGFEIGWLPATKEICDTTRNHQPEHCANHNIIYFVAWWTGRHLNYYSGLLSAVTAAFIAYFTYTLWETGRSQTRLAIDGRRTAQRQFLIYAKQTDIQREQKEIARQQFLLANRPRISIRQLRKGLAEVGKPLRFTYIATNNGEGVATLFEKNQTIVYGESAFGPLVHETIAKETAIGKLAPGEFLEIEFFESIITRLRTH